MSEQQIIEKAFGNRLRVRVCGVLAEGNSIVLIKHLGVGANGYLWSPPGGEVNYGESVKEALKREFLEETGLQITVGDFLFFNEFINKPYHSLELFFKVTKVEGGLRLGNDPELEGFRILDKIAFKSAEDVQKEGKAYYHSRVSEMFG